MARHFFLTDDEAATLCEALRYYKVDYEAFLHGAEIDKDEITTDIILTGVCNTIRIDELIEKLKP
jgi:hypothetical protein